MEKFLCRTSFLSLLSFSNKKERPPFKNNCTLIFLLLVTMLMIGNTSWSQQFGAPSNLAATPLNIGGIIDFKAPNSLGGSASLIINIQQMTELLGLTPDPAIIVSSLIII
jgi:hypothetical protein